MTREASNNKVVMLVHDLIPLTTPAFVDDGARRQFGRWLSEMCSFVDSFLTVSDSTKKDLLDYLSEICAREIDVGVIPLAHEFVLKGETLLAGPAERSPSKFKGPALEKSTRPFLVPVTVLMSFALAQLKDGRIIGARDDVGVHRWQVRIENTQTLIRWAKGLVERRFFQIHR